MLRKEYIFCRGFIIRMTYIYIIKLKHMKFIKIKTQYTPEQLELIFSNLSEELQDNIEELFYSFRYIEYKNKNNNQHMFMFGEEDKVQELMDLFKNLNLNFISSNITEDILSGNLPRLEDKHTDAMLRILMSEFLEQNQTLDNILDKISDKGMENLNNYDLHLLEQINK